MILRMKRVLLLFAIAAVMAGCDTSDGPSGSNVRAEIVITSESSVWHDAVGGMGEINYTIKGGRDELRLEAESTEQWASVVVIDDGVITYVVAPNTDKRERRARIELRYGDAKASVTIMQHVAVDVNFEATTTSGSRFTHCDNEANVHSYYVVLSTKGVDESGEFYGGAKYYCFDLCATEVVSKEEATATIPEGTYRLVVGDQLSDRGINHMYSYYYNGSEEVGLADAEVVVEDGRIVANVYLANEENHRVVYSGSLDIPVYSNTVTEGLSTLTGNHSFDIQDGVFVGAFVGDLMYNGCNTCQVYLYEYLDYETGEERGDQFQIDLQLPAGSRDICGTYTHGTTAGHFIPGSAEDLGGQFMQQNSWYMTAGFINFAPLVRGSVVVEKESDTFYVFTIDTVDDRGNAIKGVFRGRGEFIDW
jgi:hypothetical protein